MILFIARNRLNISISFSFSYTLFLKKVNKMKEKKGKIEIYKRFHREMY